MNEAEQIQSLGKKLPRGAKKKIAELSGFSQQTVVKFFKTGKASSENSLKLLAIAQPFIEQIDESNLNQNKAVSFYSQI